MANNRFARKGWHWMLQKKLSVYFVDELMMIFGPDFCTDCIKL